MIGQSSVAPLVGETAADVDVRFEKAPQTAKRTPVCIPVLRPRLPSAAEILPYLQAIDAQRWYSNYGPLVQRLEKELSKHLGVGENELVTVTNATAGITAALLALEPEKGSVCLIPSWTFAATPHAARAAGFVPWFHDVDRRTWALHPDHVKETMKNGCAPKAVVVVSPFGAPIDSKAWLQFQDDTGVSVVVDAAAGFDTVTPSSLLSVVSMHATKVFAAGEGGFVLTNDKAMSDRVRACCNFGFQNSRVAQHLGINAKMSEYHAAVALASLERWAAVRLKHLRIVEWYRQALGQLDGLSLQPGYGEGWATGTTSVILPAGSATQVAGLLLRSGIETRSWWGQGCHVQPAFASFGRGKLPITEDLGARVLGLPHYLDMQKEDIAYIVSVLGRSLRSLTGNRRAS